MIRILAILILLFLAGCSGHGRFSLRERNDALVPHELTDKHFSQGLRLEYTDNDRTYGVGQQIRTPDDISIATPQPDEPPWSGWLYADAAQHKIEERYKQTQRVTIGIIGPNSFAEDVQTWFHEDICDCTTPEGWDLQLRQEVTAMYTWTREVRDYEKQIWGLEFDNTSRWGINAGTPYTNVNYGTSVRLGHRLRSFKNETTPFSYFGTLGVNAKVAFWDTFLDGSTFRSSPSVEREYFVADITAGVHVESHGWEIGYDYVVRTQEFDEQENHKFGSITLAKSF